MPRLPQELMDEIVGHLRPESHPVDQHLSAVDASRCTRDDLISLSALSRLSRLNKSYNITIRRYVYHTIRFINHPPRPVMLGLLRPQNRRYVRRLATRPGRPINPAGFDPASQFNTWFDDPRKTRKSFNTPFSNARALIPVLPALKTQLDKSVTDLNMRQHLKDCLLRGLEIGHEDAEYGLLLCLCTDLESLTLEIGADFEIGQVWTTLHEASLPTGQAGFSRPLQRLRVCSVDERNIYHMGLGYIFSILALPSLVTFEGFFLVDRDEEEEELASDPVLPPSKVKKLVFDSVMFHAAVFERILAFCPEVEDLYLGWGFDDFGIDPRQIGRALRRYGSRLKMLELGWTPWSSQDGPDGPLGRLNTLESLQLLTIPLNKLLGESPADHRTLSWLRNTLPGSLQTLLLLYSFAAENTFTNNATLDGQLMQLMRAASEFPELSTIGFQGFGRSHSGHPQDVPLLKDLGLHLGWTQAKVGDWLIFRNNGAGPQAHIIPSRHRA